MLPPPGHVAVKQLPAVETQAKRVARHLESYEHRSAYLAALERASLALTGTVPASEFEEAIRVLGEFAGFASERLDRDGEGPDNTWRTHDERVVVISCKNEKKPNSRLHKKDLAQLFIDAKWVEEHYPKLTQVLLLIHPSNHADKGLPTDGVHVITTTGLSALIGSVKQMADALATVILTPSELEAEAGKQLQKHGLSLDELLKRFSTTFTHPLPTPRKSPP